MGVPVRSTMKLLIAAAVLTVCAFAAPTQFVENDAIVPETVAVQLTDTIADLKSQFAELQAQAKVGVEVTLGVKTTIDKMVTMVEERIEPAIKDAHSADQSDMNTLMASVQTHNNAWDEKNALLQADANNVRGLIDAEQAASKKWETDAADFTTKQNHYLDQYGKQTNTCCQRDNAAVTDIHYVPAYASCDYKKQDTSGACADVARKAVSDVLADAFTTGLSTYRGLRKSCQDLTDSMNSADGATKNQFDQCGASKNAETAAAALAASEQKRMQGEWDDATEAYHTEYAALTKAYDDRKTVVESDEKDRDSECAPYRPSSVCSSTTRRVALSTPHLRRSAESPLLPQVLSTLDALPAFLRRPLPSSHSRIRLTIPHTRTPVIPAPLVLTSTVLLPRLALCLSAHMLSQTCSHTPTSKVLGTFR